MPILDEYRTKLLRQIEELGVRKVAQGTDYAYRTIENVYYYGQRPGLQLVREVERLYQVENAFELIRKQLPKKKRLIPSAFDEYLIEQVKMLYETIPSD